MSQPSSLPPRCGRVVHVSRAPVRALLGRHWWCMFPETRSPLGGAHHMCAQLCSEFVEFLAWILLVFHRDLLVILEKSPLTAFSQTHMAL